MMVKEIVAIVAAASPHRGIGYQGQLPWKLPGDMKHFKKITMEPPVAGTTNAVVMGRKTWDSIPDKFRPLSGRTNVVLTRKNAGSAGSGQYPDGVITASSLQDAKEKLEQLENLGSVYLIGGTQVYEQAMKDGMVTKIYYTEITNVPGTMKFDAYFPEIPLSEWVCRPMRGATTATDVPKAAAADDKENGPSNLDGNNGRIDNDLHVDAKSGLKYRFLEYTRRAPPPASSKEDAGSAGSPVASVSAAAAAAASTGPSSSDEVDNVEEMQYLDLCRDIMSNGVVKGDRTGTGTISKFGTQMRFSLRDGTLPLLTTKRTFWRGVAEELLWFVSGNTNANDLADKNIHIWDGNGSREFLDSRGLQHREVGDLGPVYGFQWRHFGAAYVDMHTDYTGRGFDQLADCIDKIKNTPDDRRIIMSAWNPADLDLMALPPCHMFCQFYVDTSKNELSCQMYQRSADMGLGVPFNIASYALLTHMIAHVTGRKPGEFVHTIGDAHVYLNHVEALEEQLGRRPRSFPKLVINPEKKDIDDFVYDDFKVIGYNPHKKIAMKMAV